MRKIKFRAKRIDIDRWVYGLYFTTPLTDENSGEPISSGMYFLSYPAKPHYCIVQNNVAFTIDIETLGQYTGLQDKNNKEIYEGDIVRWPVGFRTALNDAVVEWHPEGTIGWNKRLLKVKIEYTYFPLNSNDNQEIIGNIHDNPELLKE